MNPMRWPPGIGRSGFTLGDSPDGCLVVSILVLLAFLVSGPVNAKDSDSGGTLPGRHAGTGIVVGLEYAVLDNLRLVQGMARAYAETGMTGMKH